MRHTLPIAPQFYVTAPQPCPYLAGRMERKLFTALQGEHAEALNDTLSKVDGAVDLVQELVFAHPFLLRERTAHTLLATRLRHTFSAWYGMRRIEESGKRSINWSAKLRLVTRPPMIMIYASCATAPGSTAALRSSARRS